MPFLGLVFKETMDREIDHRDAIIRNLNAEVSDLDERRRQATDTGVAYREQVESQDKKLRELSQKLENHEGVIKNQNIQIHSLKESNTHLSNEVQKAKKQNAVILIALDNLTKGANKFLEAIDTYRRNKAGKLGPNQRAALEKVLQEDIGEFRVVYGATPFVTKTERNDADALVRLSVPFSTADEPGTLSDTLG